MRRRTATVLLGAVLTAALSIAPAAASVRPPTVDPVAVKEARLEVGLGVRPEGQVRQGTVLTYTARVRNVGDAQVAPVRLDVLLPAGVALLGTGDAGCSERGNGIRCDLGKLQVGASEAVTVSGIVKPTASGAQVAEARAGANGVPGATGTVKTVVRPGTDLAIRLQSPARAVAGRTYELTAHVLNNGPIGASRVNVDFGTERATIAGLGAGCRIRRGEGHCELGGLAPGKAAIVHVTVRVDPGATGVIGNFAATAATDLGDTEPENNTAIASVRVVKPVAAKADLLPETGADPRPLAVLGFLLLLVGTLMRQFVR